MVIKFSTDPVELDPFIGNYDEFIDNQVVRASEFVHPLRQSTELRKKVYKSLAYVQSTSTFPYESQDEQDVSMFIYHFFRPIVRRVGKEMNVKLLLQGQHILDPCPACSAIKLLSQSKGVVYFIFQPKLQKTGYRIHLVVTEVKTGCLENGYLQGMAYAVRAHELNFPKKKDGNSDKDKPDSKQQPEANAPKRLIYVICTNGVRMTVMSFDGESFKMLFQRIVMCPKMYEEEKCPVTESNKIGEKYFKYAAHWLEMYSEMVDVVYSCLLKVAGDTVAC